jgi:hypothetical protein
VVFSRFRREILERGMAFLLMGLAFGQDLFWLE